MPDKMAAVGVAESAGGVIVVGEEDCRVGGVGGVLEKEAVDGLEEELGLVAGEGELAAEIGLEIGRMSRAAAMPLPEMSPLTSPSRWLWRARKS